MNKSDQRIRKFNPGTVQSDEEVKEQFVVRKDELKVIASLSCENENVLVVAPRGQGKTMLLARVAAEMNTNDELPARLLPIRFMEESHEIFNLADFWLDTLFYLARESTKHYPSLAEELKKTHYDLINRWQEKDLSNRVRDTVLEAAVQLDRKLVLMVENLQALCKNVDEDFGWKLRHVLQSEPQIMLIATATSRFEWLAPEQPFHELFEIVELKPLNTEGCRCLWQAVSDDAVSERDIRPLEILTGGNPRLLVIVAGFARHRSLLQLMEELVSCIDEHTEYFRSHLEVLPKGERRVYISVLDLWQSSSASEIATRARMDIRSVSTLIGRLVERNFVTAEGSGKKRRYATTERLYRIYYKLRREHDETTVVEDLIHFMTVFYSHDELAEMSDRLIEEAKQSPTIREGIRRAVVERPQLGSLFPNMARPSIDRTSSLTAITDNESVKQLFEEASAHEELGQFEAAIEAYDEVIKRFDSNNELQEEVAWALSDKGHAYEELGQFEAAIEAYDEAIKRFGSSNEQFWVAWALSDKGHAYEELGQFEAAIEAYDEAIKYFDSSNEQFWVAWALSDKGHAYEELGQFEAAIEAYDEAIKRFGSNNELQSWVASAWSYKSLAYKELGQFEAAIGAYDEVIERFGSSNEAELQKRVAWALYDKGSVQRQRGQFEAAIGAYDEVIERFGSSNEPIIQEWVAWALSDKGSVQRQRGQFEAAIGAYDEVIERFGSSNEPIIQKEVARALSDKGYAQRQRRELEAAIATYDKAIKRFGSSDEAELQEWVARALSDKGYVQRQRREFEAAIATYDKAIKRFGSSDEPTIQKEVAWALYDKGSVQERRGQFEAAIEAYDKVIKRFGSSNEAELQEWVARALSAKGSVQAQRGQFEVAIEIYDEVIERFDSSNEPTIQKEVARALYRKGMRQIEMGLDFAKEALNTCRELELRLGVLTENDKKEFAWKARYMRVLVLLVQGRHLAAMFAFRSAYAVFVPSDEMTMYEMQRIVPDLIATGASAHDLVDILLSDRPKSGALAPLIVALRQRTGEEVRAPEEVLEVAADIRERIEARVAKDAPETS